MFHEERGMAVCGLACVLCSVTACPGCRRNGCANRGQCSIYRCAADRGLTGCYQCGDFPCGAKAFQSARVRAFNRYAKEHGMDRLMTKLRTNFDAGITYHRPDGLKGDYDTPDSEELIMSLIDYGRAMNPYEYCPVLETDHFVLRLVQEADAEDLLRCYADPAARPIFNADYCTSDFQYSTSEEMLRCIQAWLREYREHRFVRWSMIDRHTGKAIGTVEMFADPGRWGVLRVDVASSYEERALLDELFGLAKEHFFKLFQIDRMLTKAVPSASERIAALQQNGFVSVQLPGREHYYICT